MAANFDPIKAEVARDSDVKSSAATLIRGFKAQLDAAIAADNAGDDAALTDLSASLAKSSDDLAAAVAENTTV